MSDLSPQRSHRFDFAKCLITLHRACADWLTFSSHRHYFPLMFAALTGRSGHGFAIPLSLIRRTLRGCDGWAGLVSLALAR